MLKENLRKKNRKIKWLQPVLASIVSAVTILCMSVFNSLPVFATTLESSTAYTGTKKLIEDATKILLILAPVITTCVIIYFFIRKAMADEMDHRKWQTRITVALICGIGATLASGLITTLMAYYK